MSSNLANDRLRYELVPYLYSLAHQAYRTGAPVMPPPVVFYQTDNNLRALGHEKMLGRDLLAAIVAKHGETERDVYLPAGTWVDWHSNQRIPSTGQWLSAVPVRRAGLFRLPLYARAGAVVPLMPVDASTLNAFGQRADGSVDDTLRVRAFALDGPGPATFTLFEDDGKTSAYQGGAVRTTGLVQTRPTDDTLVVTVQPAQGTYTAAPTSRNAVVELVTDRTVQQVTLNGGALPPRASLADFTSNPNGWFAAGSALVLAKSGVQPVSATRDFAFTLGAAPTARTSQFQAISLPGAGNGWNPADPARALQCVGGKVWKGQLTLLPEPYKFAANRTWTVNWGQGGQVSGPNFPALSQAGTYDVTFDEANPAAATVTLVQPSPSTSARFVCENGQTTFGTSVYVVGSVPELGNWNPNDAILLKPDGPYPNWTGVVTTLPAQGQVQWKCLKRLEGGDRHVVQWEADPNNVLDRTVFQQTGKF